MAQPWLRHSFSPKKRLQSIEGCPVGGVSAVASAYGEGGEVLAVGPLID
jgi:hypothetical protein